MDNFSNTFFSWLGMMQRTKLGFVFLRVAMSLDSCSLYSWPTVRNMPLRVLKAPGISDIPETLSRPTIRSTERCEKKMRKETLGKKPAGFNFIIWILNQVNSIQMHVTRSNEWLLSLHFLVVNTNQERVEAIHTTRTSETPHKHWVNEGRETGVGRRMTEWSHKKPVKRGEITHHYEKMFLKIYAVSRGYWHCQSVVLSGLCVKVQLNVCVRKVTNFCSCSGHVFLWW